MMPGTNTLYLSTEAMREAIQIYLDRQTIGSLGKVTSLNLNLSNKKLPRFKVTLENKK
jgi:hypothetical protein